MNTISKTPLTIFQRLTEQEQVALVTSTHVQVRVAFAMFCMAERVLSTDPRMAQFKPLLVSEGILTQERADHIFSFNW